MSTQMSPSNPDDPDFGDELFHSAELASLPAAPPRRQPGRRRLLIAFLLVMSAGGAMVAVHHHEPDLVQSWVDQLHAAIRPVEAEAANVEPAKTEVVKAEPGKAEVVAEAPRPSPEMPAQWTTALKDAQKQGQDALARQQADFAASAKRMKEDFVQATQRMERKLTDAEQRSAADRQTVQRLETQLDEVRTQAKVAEREAQRFEGEMLAKQKETERFQKQLAEAQARLADTQELARRTQEELLEERSRTSQLQKQVETLAQLSKSRSEERPAATTKLPPALPKSPAFFGAGPRGVETAESPSAPERAPQQRQQWAGKLSESAPRERKHGAPSVVHTATLKQGVRYVIDLTSSSFDPILRLEDAQGREIQEDDDGGDGLNSRIHYTPTRTGVYRLVVTRYSGAGDYQLSVR